jgi:omega-6 fatty acid desaturase (delta-12 desaturase)
MTMIALLLAPSSLGLHHSPLLRQSRVVQRSSASAPARMIALDPLVASDMNERFDLPLLSGLQGKAMLVEKSDIPTKAQVRQAVPKHCFERDTAKSMMYAAISVAQSAACLAAARFIPMRRIAAPLWLAWAAVTGTVWTGMWVVAHECGHGAFSDNRQLQDAVGYVLHSILLVPYFSWQRSHAVHHANTNHITKGETHVPVVVNGRAGIENEGGEGELENAKRFGKGPWGLLQLVLHLVIGWPAYLLWGATGGPKYGTSNHFVPFKPFDTALWPASWPKKVMRSDLGIVAMMTVLGAWAAKAGGGTVALLYGLPLCFTNMWLVAYTWLQHTDVDVPHLTNDEFSYMRGAFLTVDRPYGPIFDWLHHKIGSTHVAHHIDCTIPHYRALEATNAIKEAFPKAYLYDPTPVHKAMWRVASNCIAVKLRPDGRYTWVPVAE